AVDIQTMLPRFGIRGGAEVRPLAEVDGARGRSNHVHPTCLVGELPGRRAGRVEDQLVGSAVPEQDRAFDWPALWPDSTGDCQAVRSGQIGGKVGLQPAGSVEPYCAAAHPLAVKGSREATLRRVPPAAGDEELVTLTADV